MIMIKMARLLKNHKYNFLAWGGKSSDRKPGAILVNTILHMSTFTQFVGDPEELPSNLPSKLDAVRYISLKTSPTLSGPALLSAVADDILEKYQLNNDKPFLIRYF